MYVKQGKHNRLIFCIFLIKLNQIILISKDRRGEIKIKKSRYNTIQQARWSHLGEELVQKNKHQAKMVWLSKGRSLRLIVVKNLLHHQLQSRPRTLIYNSSSFITWKKKNWYYYNYETSINYTSHSIKPAGDDVDLFDGAKIRSTNEDGVAQFKGKNQLKVTYSWCITSWGYWCPTGYSMKQQGPIVDGIIGATTCSTKRGADYLRVKW